MLNKIRFLSKEREGIPACLMILKTYLLPVEGRVERPKAPGGAFCPTPYFFCKPARMHLPGVPPSLEEPSIFDETNCRGVHLPVMSQLSNCPSGPSLDKPGLRDPSLGNLPNRKYVRTESKQIGRSVLRGLRKSIREPQPEQKSQPQ